MRKTISRKFKFRKKIAGILGLCSVISVPVSGAMITDKTQEIALAASESSPADSLLHDYVITSSQLRSEEEQLNTSWVTVEQTSLAALAKIDSVLNGSPDEEVTEPQPEEKVLMSGAVQVTAYSSTPDQTDSSPFITANGTHVHDGTLACNFLPFGTKVKFPEYSGDKIYIVEDRMNKRFSNRMDIWFASRSAALQFGRQTLEYVVVE